MAEAIFERIICIFGCFQTISRDRGTQFSNSLLKHLNALTGSKHIFATTAHHAAVGQVERANQSVERILAKYVNFERNDWDNSLSLAKYAINISVAEATGLSPYVVTYGREPRTALDIALRKPNNIPPNMENDFEDLIARVTLLDKIVKENSEYTKLKMKEYYDKHSTEVKYKVGQLVLLHLHQSLSTGKLATRWDGPYRIVAREGPNFKLRRISDGTILPLPVHPDRLQAFYDRQLEPPTPPSRLNRTAEADELSFNDNFIATDAPGTATCAPPNALPDAVNRSPMETGACASRNYQTDGASYLQSEQSHSSLEAGNGNQRTARQAQLPRPNTKCDDSTARNVHSIPKARKTKNGFEYYIIYEDQINKNIGEYVPENKLIQNEKAYIEMHKDKIRVMRHTPRININSLHVNNNNMQSWSPWFELNI